MQQTGQGRSGQSRYPWRQRRQRRAAAPWLGCPIGHGKEERSRDDRRMQSIRLGSRRVRSGAREVPGVPVTLASVTARPSTSSECTGFGAFRRHGARGVPGPRNAPVPGRQKGADWGGQPPPPAASARPSRSRCRKASAHGPWPTATYGGTSSDSNVAASWTYALAHASTSSCRRCSASASAKMYR